MELLPAPEFPPCPFRHGQHSSALRRLFAGAALAACAAAFSATPPPPDMPSGAAVVSSPAVDAETQRRAEALAAANAAVVGVRSRSIDGAGSVATLGRERRGSGVVIGDDGLVLTIGYLILEAEQVDLQVAGSRSIPAAVVAYDPASGFGLVRALAPVGVAPVRFGSPVDAARAGADEPLVFASSAGVSLARLVSRRPFTGYWEYHIEDALFTTPPRPDHSGAALFNLDGELVGIGSLVVADALGPGRAGLPGNMFVPTDLLQPILAELRVSGSSRQSHRAWIGAHCLERAGKVLVMRIAPDSPAEQAGLRPGDEIVAIDGAEVRDLAGFYRALWQGDQAEREVRLAVRRGARTERIAVQAVDRMRTLRRPIGV